MTLTRSESTSEEQQLLMVEESTLRKYKIKNEKYVNMF